jgi:hypothetical protein
MLQRSSRYSSGATLKSRRISRLWLPLAAIAIAITALVAPSAAKSTSNPVAAIQAAKAGDTVVVDAGTFTFDSLSVPKGVNVVGAGLGSTWLKGRLLFGSNSTFSDLKIGDNLKATQNRAGAHNTSFVRCQFRGGGGDYEATTSESNVIYLMDTYDLTFDSCNIERNLGVENANKTLRQRLHHQRDHPAAPAVWAYRRTNRPRRAVEGLPLWRQQRGRHRLPAYPRRDVGGQRRRDAHHRSEGSQLRELRLRGS